MVAIGYVSSIDFRIHSNYRPIQWEDLSLVAAYTAPPCLPLEMQPYSFGHFISA